MRDAELSLFSYEILGLIGREGAGPHDLKRMVERGRLLAWAGESRYYTEPKRLAKLGYLEARKEPGRTRERTVYSLKAKGVEALREYAATDAEVTPFKSDVLTRLLIADLVGERVTRDSIVALRGELAALRQRLDEAEESGRRIAHRSKYLTLSNRFLGRLLDLHEQLVDEVEAEFVSTAGREG